MSFLSQPRTVKIKNTYINGFLDCSGDIILRSGNVIIGNISQPGYNANQMSLMVNGRTEMNGNLIVNGNLLVSSNNIALGLRAGNIINGIQDGVPNGLNTTAVGSFSGMNHTGQNNTFIGSVAGQNTSTTYFSRTGSNNTYLGYRTSSNNSAWGNSTAVGTGSVISASNQIVLGTAEESVSIAGNVRITNNSASTTTTTGALTITGGVGILGNINTGGFSTFTRDSSFSGNILLTQLNNPLWLVSRNASVINSTLSTNGSDVGIFYGTTIPAAASLIISPRGAARGIKMDIAGNVGIHNATPRFTFDVSGIIGINNNTDNKKLVLWDNSTAENPTTATNFFGFGINSNTLRYQVSTNLENHTFFGGNIQYGRINNNTSGFQIGSDRKLKKNITELDYGLNEILQLKPSRYLMKEENEGDKTHIGLIAQDVQTILPEVVHECLDDDNTTTLMLSHIGFIPVLIHAIQQQQQQIQNLEERLRTLENSR
jgi:hypothetical protein